LNSKDLTLTAIDGIPARVPFNPFIMHLAASLIGVDYCRDYVQKPEILVEGQIKCASLFGIDHVNVSTDAYREASAWGVQVDFSGHTPIARPGTELNWDEFDSVEAPDLLESDRIQNRIKAVKLLSEQVGSRQCIVGWIEAPFAELICLFGMMTIMKLTMRKTRESQIKKNIKRILPIQLEFAKLQVEAGADIIGAGDSAVSLNGPMRYERDCLELTQKLFRDIQKHVPVLYHTCGDNSPVDKEGRDMLKLIASSGASILDIDYQVDLAVAKQKIGNQICIRGNSNTSILGNSSTPINEIVANISNNIEIGKRGGRYMYAAGCEWPWMPFELALRNLSIARTLTEKLGYY